jgi:anti-sigma B factor antagonist
VHDAGNGRPNWDPMATLQINVSRDGQVLVVSPTDYLDCGNRRLLAEFVEGLLHVTARVVIDLRGVLLCDAASMATLVHIAERCAARGGWLRLAAPGGQVARAFAIIAFGEDVPTYATVAGAVVGDDSQRIKD